MIHPIPFILLAAVAVAAALGMLLSHNAVHSALYLVLNFITVAIFYLALNAPFIAMVQITVYAGAIVVLFLFVIMLLGAERLRSAADEVRGRERLHRYTALALALVLIGEGAEPMSEAWPDVPAERAGSMAEAVALAHRAAGRGGVVLLSPGCASFDMFTDYEDRGRRFKDEVSRLAQGGAHA